MDCVPKVVVEDVEVMCDVVGGHFDVFVWAVHSPWSSDVWPEAAVDEGVLDGVVRMGDVKFCYEGAVFESSRCVGGVQVDLREAPFVGSTLQSVTNETEFVRGVAQLSVQGFKSELIAAS